MIHFYTFSIFLYHLAIKIASLFDKKAFLWVKGRDGLLDKIALGIDHDADHAWFHCSSVGEFEQGRPVIERFRAENPHYKIILTFFSPSGYELRKNYELADYVFYLPADTPSNARRFIEYVNPRIAIFVKYDYWFHHLNALHEKKIPVVFISAIFRPSQMFFQWWSGWYRKQLKKITYFFVQNTASRDLLYSIGVRNVVVSGDTRFDRVFAISRKPSRFDNIERFIQGSVIMAAGSTWPEDEKMLAKLINEDNRDIKYIIVPHEISRNHIKKFVEQLTKPSVIFSEYDENSFREARVLIIDKMGMLSSLYQYASVAYIGGGFGKGIHNTLEAAVFGMPIFFGPNYRKFSEALELVYHKAAIPVTSSGDFILKFNELLMDYEQIKEKSDTAKHYVMMKRGATEKIMVFINTILNPKNYKASSLEMLNMN